MAVPYPDDEPEDDSAERELIEEPLEGTSEDQPPLDALVAGVYALRTRRARSITEDYLRSLLEPPSGSSPVRHELLTAATDLERRVAAVPSGTSRGEAQAALVIDLAERILAVAERVFILDPARSTLELLPAAERDRFLSFAWAAGDFPGGPPGPNEARAELMFAALTRLRPERRANRGSAAAVLPSEFDDAMQARLAAALTAVPGERGQRLHRDASAAFVDVRTAAAGDGVTISIGNSYRPAERARAAAERAGNRLAVASFSAHTLGLAVDLKMSHGSLRYAETTTRPFQNLVDMYKSPVHKWMFLKAERHGWYPYAREPWHWEYNPPGFRDRLRAAPATEAFHPEASPAPVTPARSSLTITNTVGRGGRNQAADVRAVQARLVELGLLDATAAAEENPPGPVADESALSRTIGAIEQLQRQINAPVDGKIDLTGATRQELERRGSTPSTADLTAIANARTAIRQATSRGLRITRPVGATSSGNVPDDVSAVQRRLVEIGRLRVAHGETPAAGTTPIPESALTTTIAALRTFQNEVRFWIARGTLKGAVTPGVVAPGDATAALMDRITVYTMTIGAVTLTFRDHIPNASTQSETGVAIIGTASPSALPAAAFRGLGLSAAEAASLKAVASHEGNFDAVNTYDRALVSVGFIQFAGGRGLPRYLAWLKSKQPAKFRDLLQAVGIDVEFALKDGKVESPQIVVWDPATGAALRGQAAETSIRDDKRLTTALSLSGRDRDVQLAQIEAAVRDYVRPALDARITVSGRSAARLGTILRSQKGMAALFDRSIQEGVERARRRFERVIQRVAAAAGAPPSVPMLQAREGDILAELERDLQAAADVAQRIAEARAALLTLSNAATTDGASVPSLLVRPELADARRAVASARTGLGGIVNVSSPRGVPIERTLQTMATTLEGEASRLSLTTAPPGAPALASVFTLSRQALATIAAPVSTAPAFLSRIQRIRRSPLDAGLAESD